MELINHTSFTFAPLAGRIGFPGHSMTFIVKATFDLVPGGAAAISDEQVFPTGDELYPDDDEKTGSCRYAADFAYFKNRADLLLAGKCHPAGGRPAAAARVVFRVGAHSKTLAVFGNRYWNPVARTISDPEPFTEMELRYERSFGGVKDPRNPVGKGLSEIKQADGRRVWPLPNIEDIKHLIDSPASRPAPAGFGPIGSMWQERYKKLGSYGGDWLQTRWPWYPLDFDWTHFNAAPKDMQVDGYLKGDEALYFENLHPRHPVYESRLPGIAPRLFFNRADPENIRNEAFHELELNLDTLWADMEAEKLVLVWRGVIEVLSKDYEELTHVLLVSENGKAPSRSKTEYHELFLQHIHKKSAPEPPSGETETPDKTPPFDLEAETEKAEAEIRAAMLAAGLDPDEPLPEPGEADKEKEAELLKKWGLEEAVPPPPITREVVQQRVAAGEALFGEDLRGIDLSGLDLTGGDFREAILSGVNMENAILPAVDFSKADLSKTVLSAAGLSAAKLKDTDLTGANLTGADLTGANLDDAICDHANFQRALMANITAKGASFREADLSHARLRNGFCQAADFSNSRLVEADFSGADFNEATLEGVKARGANFSDADLSGLRASGGSDFSKGRFWKVSAPYAIWENAVLDEADFSYAAMEGVNLASASLKSAVLFGADLRYARLSKACLQRAVCVRMNLFFATLEKADLTETDFSAASLYGVEFLDATVVRTQFKQSNLKMTKLVNFYESI